MKKNYIYLYTLRIWDPHTTSEAAQKGRLGDFLFDEEHKTYQPTSLKKSGASLRSDNSAAGDSPYEGVEEFRWIEIE